MPIRIDIPMPEYCMVCFAYDREWGCCNIPDYDHIEIPDPTEKAPWCPLKEVK